MNLSICNRALLLIASVLISCASAVAESQPGGSDVTVPDLETKIRNSGSSVPEQALPELKAPAPVPIPEAVIDYPCKRGKRR